MREVKDTDLLHSVLSVELGGVKKLMHHWKWNSWWVLIVITGCAVYCRLIAD